MRVESALRSVLRRCWKASATTWEKISISTSGSDSTGRGTMRTIEDVTLGGGTKAPGGTSKSLCMT